MRVSAYVRGYALDTLISGMSVMIPAHYHRSLRVKLDEPVGRHQFAKRTPAMAVGITDTVWSVLRLLNTVVLPTPCRS